MVVDRGHNECLLQPLNASFQPFYCFNYCTPPKKKKKQGILSGQSQRNHWCVFFFFPISRIDSFEVGACIESLDLYFVKSITYFLVVCMSCIFNKPFELTLRVAAENIKRITFFSLPLFFFSPSHSFAFSSRFPCFHWTPSSDNYKRKVKDGGYDTVVGFYSYQHLPC